MSKYIWSTVILLGMLIARLGFASLNLTDPAMPVLTVTLLITGGMLVGLVGATGLLGMLDWLARAPLERRHSR
ncbi:hypothetical protein ACFOLJ_30835 [Rugamonas sp. CCM 8940]|uniref:hypothetical protein n=1 Tax=Rugamonas sp. CCM 8940 TaxID=2765359 RepID=UPI0018F5606F|nr:hypothetical protein [Rugamonas sp. CCM 8940]MBJ7309251.1 hypothetical protein [Rugamonas sp. CCM 8940]